MECNAPPIAPDDNSVGAIGCKVRRIIAATAAVYVPVIAHGMDLITAVASVKNSRCKSFNRTFHRNIEHSIVRMRLALPNILNQCLFYKRAENDIIP